MQLYTKILIGMVVGVIVGLCFGPNAALLDHDLYYYSNGKTAPLYLSQDMNKETLKLGDAPLKLRLLKHEEGTLTNAQGQAFKQDMKGITWAFVELKLKPQHLLGDRGDALKLRLNKHLKVQKVQVGQKIKLWLKIPYTQIENGAIVAQKSPISSWGQWLLGLLEPIGALFMRLLKMVIVPLVFSSLLVGVASLGDVRKLGRLGSRTIGLYIGTTAIAVGLGLLCANLITPGSFMDPEAKAKLLSEFQGAASSKSEAASQAPSMIENLINIIPTNPIGSLAGGEMLQIIFFALMLGVALTMLKEKGETLVRFFDDLQEAMVVLINLIMKLAPYGVAALVASVIGQSGWSVLKALLVYTVTVLIGLTLHAVLVYGGLVKLIVKVPLREFFKAIRPAQLLAFSTSSSSAALPVSMECAEKNVKMSKEVASFVLPLGSTVNMDGTALYQGVAAVFIAQVFGLDLTIGDQLSIVLAATMASIGAAGVPGAGIVTLALVLTTSGIPQVGLALILGMDRLLDMFRTAVNVTGDLSVATVMAKLEGETLLTGDEEDAFADPATDDDVITDDQADV
jgi:proton glutamate symport protein